MVGRLPALEQTFTTRPQPRSTIRGIAARIARIGAITFTSQAAFHSSSATSSRPRRFDVPALLTSTSSEPNRSSAAATRRSPASGAVTSRLIPVASPPASAHLKTASSNASCERATSTTRAPSRQSRSATARPIPRVAPVTAHDLPSISRSISAARVMSPGDLDSVGDGDLAIVGQQAVDGTLGRDGPQTLDLIRGQAGRQVDGDVERARPTVVAVLHVDVDPQLADVPFLPGCVHLE